jgi:hypothetical protein
MLVMRYIIFSSFQLRAFMLLFTLKMVSTFFNVKLLGQNLLACPVCCDEQCCDCLLTCCVSQNTVAITGNNL